MAIGYSEKLRLLDCLRYFADKSHLIVTVDDCDLSGRLDVRFAMMNGRFLNHSTINTTQTAEEDIPKMLSGMYGMATSMLMARIKGEQETSAAKTDIKNVIFNAPATIVVWGDGTKTVVKCSKGEVYDPEKGLAMAIAKKMLGNEGNYYKLFRKWLPEDIA